MFNFFVVLKWSCDIFFLWKKFMRFLFGYRDIQDIPGIKTFFKILIWIFIGFVKRENNVWINFVESSMLSRQ